MEGGLAGCSGVIAAEVGGGALASILAMFWIAKVNWRTAMIGAILVVVLAFNLFGEGMRDILNPKLRERN